MKPFVTLLLSGLLLASCECTEPDMPTVQLNSLADGNYHLRVYFHGVPYQLNQDTPYIELDFTQDREEITIENPTEKTVQVVLTGGVKNRYMRMYLHPGDDHVFLTKINPEP